MTNSRINQIISEEINRVVRNSCYLTEKKKKNNKQEEYIEKHGQKENAGMRGEVERKASSDSINNAAIARQIEKDHPDIHIDSSYISKMTKGKPGASGGRFHWDKEKADAYSEACTELGV